MSGEFRKVLRQNVAIRLVEIQTEWNVHPDVIRAVEAKLKHSIRIGFSMSCFVGCVAEKAPRNEFLIQIPESIWLGIILALRGHHNASNVAIRQAIELLFKHLYFTDHPVEYGWIQADDGLREFGFQMLSEYAKRLKQFDEFTEKDACFENLTTVFSEASRYVHVHSPKFFGKGALGLTNADAVAAFGHIHATLERIGTVFPLLCSIFQYELFLSVSASEQKMILDSWSPKLHAAFTQWRRRRDLAA